MVPKLDAVVPVLIVAAPEARSILKCLEGRARNRLELAFRINALGEELITPDVVATEELAQTLHEATPLGGYILHHAPVAAGLVAAPVRVEVHVADALDDAEAAVDEPIGVGVYNVDVVGRRGA